MVARVVIVVGITLGLSHPAAAQSTSGGPAPNVRAGQAVWVTSAAGQETRGVVAAVSDAAIEVRSRGVLTAFRWPEVRLIETRDSVVNGLVWGAGIGAVAGGLPALMYVKAECCWYDGQDTRFVLGSAALGAGAGAAIGTLVDYLRVGRRPIYTKSTTVSVAPVVMRRRVGVGATVRW